jgi:dTDP-4-dehydrorhamnose 3,5-epimerase-like enzyme
MTVAGDALARAPGKIRIDGCRPFPRIVHRDPRGFLVETLRRDDGPVQGDRFAMSYLSLTIPGEFRDRDRWHVHQIQTDRFVVPLGEMILALYDGRPTSATHGTLDVVRMAGLPFLQAASPAPRDDRIDMVPIPPGVYHAIGNLSKEPFLLQNYPTELYDAKDEGRVPFSQVPIPVLDRPFAWSLVRREDAP